MKQMKIIVACDSFKGSMTSREACEAARSGLKHAFPAADIIVRPVSDGGDGMIDAYDDPDRYHRRLVHVHDALMRPCEAEYLIGNDSAIIESAQACGLLRVKDETPRPLLATSYGVGELLADAISQGCLHITVGLGGSATSDCGLGMLEALKERLPRKPFSASANNGVIFTDRRHRTWDDIQLPYGLDITLACDVDNPLFGDNGAAAVYGPQKGASPSDIRQLDRRAMAFARLSARHFGKDCSQQPGAGAAGGLGYAFMQYLDARMVPGAELMLSHCDFDHYAAGAAFVVTGEGSSDRQTLMGKMPSAILRHCQQLHVPVVLLSGRVADKDQLLAAGFSRVESINPPGQTPEESMLHKTAIANMERAASVILS